jgi:transcriptional regulator with GAF, ATPase, and Fis domain
MAAQSTRDAIPLVRRENLGKQGTEGSSEATTAPAPAVAPVEFDGWAVQQNDLTIVGAGAGLRAVIAQIEQVAPTGVAVLLEGETGSGKEVVARLLHARSRRAAGPMIRVNCGAIPPELVDSELFGHERGSFTGAVGQRLGWFERAHGGTLFLDEVAELPLAAQVRLLRVLQEGTLERVGGGRVIAVDVRVVTATHRDLGAMCAAGTFRADLWYRLNGFTVRIPPLRERMEDLPALVAHFANRAGVRLTGVPLNAKQEEVEALLGYAWPGNVRELAAVVERAAILGGGRRLDVTAALGQAGPRAATPPRAIARTESSPERFPTLDEAMRAHVERALILTNGRIEGRGGAADILGLNPHTLRGKMRKLGIDWAAYRNRREEPPSTR